MDPEFSDTHARFVEEHPDVLTEGYATAHDRWVCPSCAEDFVEQFGWRLVRR